jgi:hypothetical protein
MSQESGVWQRIPLDRRRLGRKRSTSCIAAPHQRVALFVSSRGPRLSTLNWLGGNHSVETQLLPSTLGLTWLPAQAMALNPSVILARGLAHIKGRRHWWHRRSLGRKRPRNSVPKCTASRSVLARPFVMQAFFSFAPPRWAAWLCIQASAFPVSRRRSGQRSPGDDVVQRWGSAFSGAGSPLAVGAAAGRCIDSGSSLSYWCQTLKKVN